MYTALKYRYNIALFTMLLRHCSETILTVILNHIAFKNVWHYGCNYSFPISKILVILITSLWTYMVNTKTLSIKDFSSDHQYNIRLMKRINPKHNNLLFNHTYCITLNTKTIQITYILLNDNEKYTC